jgi:hypothetical protein
VRIEALGTEAIIPEIPRKIISAPNCCFSVCGACFDQDTNLHSSASKKSEITSEAATNVELQRGRGDGVRIEQIVYPLAILIAIATWFFAIRYPLWMDETASYWQISGGFSEIWARHGMFIAHPYLFWATKTLLGSSELALRLPSIVAMLAATVLLYKTAEEQFGYEAANIATVIFCIHPSVIFASIDARPYPFATLCLVIAVRYMLRWSETGKFRDGVIFGVATAFVLLFHLLFGMIVPAFALFLLLTKKQTFARYRWTWLIALAPFVLLSAVVIPHVWELMHSSNVRVFTDKPTIDELALAFAPDFVLVLFALTMLMATAIKRVSLPARLRNAAPALALTLAFVPLLGMYLISEVTPIHVFVGRYYLCAVPGIALCWGMMLSWVDCKWLRAAFCIAIAAASMAINYNPMLMAPHGYTWKFANDAVELNTAHDHAPVLICSGIVDSNAATGPLDADNGWLPQLSYYPLSSPVLGLPYSLTPIARKEIDEFITQSAEKKQRFVAMGWTPAYDSIRYMIEKADGKFEAHRVGIYDNIAVVEFRPKQ